MCCKRFYTNGYCSMGHLLTPIEIENCYLIPAIRIKNKHGTTPIQAMEDAKSAIRFLRLNAKSFFINPNRIAAAGGSAGQAPRGRSPLDE